MSSSRISGFYKLSRTERLQAIQSWLKVDLSEAEAILNGEAGLSVERANQMIENVLGLYALPFGLATNFLINAKDYLIPMVVEEPSIVAACSFAAKLVRDGGGFTTHSDDPIMIGQIQVLDVANLEQAIQNIESAKNELLAHAIDPDSSIIKYGGGPRDIVVRRLSHPNTGDMLIVHLLLDVRDAMGANAINTACEKLAPRIEQLTQGRVNLRILSNYSDQRTATATCRIPQQSLATATMNGEKVVDAIVEAAIFAEIDTYRAVTHNKGVMNGIDALMLATGNDWRAVEASAHAYACRDGQYVSMTKWWKDDNGDLRGSLKLPMAVGIVGGATRVHPTAQLAMQLLNVASAQELAEIAVAVGLAQNLAAIRALATVGIQSGHMALHARQIAMAAGASEADVQTIADQLISENNIRLERAKQLVQQLQQN